MCHYINTSVGNRTDSIYFTIPLLHVLIMLGKVLLQTNIVYLSNLTVDGLILKIIHEMNLKKLCNIFHIIFYRIKILTFSTDI